MEDTQARNQDHLEPSSVRPELLVTDMLDNLDHDTWDLCMELLELMVELLLLPELLDPGQRSCKENCKESTRMQRSWGLHLELLGNQLQDWEGSLEAVLEYL